MIKRAECAKCASVCSCLTVHAVGAKQLVIVRAARVVGARSVQAACEVMCASDADDRLTPLFDMVVSDDRCVHRLQAHQTQMEGSSVRRGGQAHPAEIT